MAKARVKVPELMGAKEAAAELGVLQTNLRTIKGLPAPVQKIGATTLWLAADIRRLAKERAAARS